MPKEVFFLAIVALMAYFIISIQARWKTFKSIYSEGGNKDYISIMGFFGKIFVIIVLLFFAMVFFGK